MKTKGRIIFILLVSLIYLPVTRAQNDSTLQVLKKRIESGFDKFEKRDSSIIENQLRLKLENQYFEFISKAEPIDYGKTNEEEKRARKLIEFYSSVNGVEQQIDRWYAMIRSSEGGILSIPQFLSSTIRGKTKPKNNIQFSPPAEPNKYAVLILPNMESINPLVFLNDKPVCNVEDASNGLVVESEVNYDFKLQANGKFFCQTQLYFYQRERKELSCP